MFPMAHASYGPVEAGSNIGATGLGHNATADAFAELEQFTNALSNSINSIEASMQGSA